MRNVVIGAVVLGVLGGCSPSPPEPQRPSITAPIDTSVAIDEVEDLVRETLYRYVELTNDIVRQGDPSRIGEVVTSEWADEETQSFLALDALGGAAPLAAITRFELMNVRGRYSVVDAYAAVCISGATNPTHVSVTLVPRDGAMAIAEISPWKDSSWCASSFEP